MSRLLMSGVLAMSVSACVTLPDRVTTYTGCPAAAIPQRPPPPPAIVISETEDGEGAVMSKEDWRALSIHRAQLAQALEVLYAFSDTCQPKEK